MENKHYLVPSWESFTEYIAKVGEKMIFDNMTFAEANSDLGWKDGLDILTAGAVGTVSGVAKFGKICSKSYWEKKL